MSMMQIETVDGSHEWRIEQNALLVGITMGIGKYMSSVKFMVGGYLWVIRFYPDGLRLEDQADYVSLFIALASDGVDVPAFFEFKLEDQSGNGNHKLLSCFHRKAGPHVFRQRRSKWGCKHFYRRTSLRTSDYLKDDCLVITATVGVVKSHVEGPKLYRTPEPAYGILKLFGPLLGSNERADVRFEVDGDIFTAHKDVLGKRCPLFKVKLCGVNEEKNMQHVKLKLMEAPVFRALLYFIYWDELPETPELTALDSKGALTLMAQRIIAAADQFGLKRLKRLCEAKLCENVAIHAGVQLH